MRGGAGDRLFDPNSLPGVLRGAHICGCPDQGFFKVDQKAGSGVDVRAAASGEPPNTVPGAGRLFYSRPWAWLSPVTAVVSILLIPRSGEAADVPGLCWARGRSARQELRAAEGLSTRCLGDGG